MIRVVLTVLVKEWNGATPAMVRDAVRATLALREGDSVEARHPPPGTPDRIDFLGEVDSVTSEATGEVHAG